MGTEMKIGAISDSHGDKDTLRLAVRKMAEEEKVETIIHLGDDYDDIQTIEIPGPKLIRIPGVFSSYYKDPRIPNRIIKEFSNRKVLLTHAPTTHGNDLPTDKNPEDVIAKENINIVLHGHTHIPKIEEKARVIWINPGHLKSEDKRGYRPSYAIMELDEDKVKVRIIDLERGKEILAKTFEKI